MIFYSILIAAIVTLLAVSGLQHIDFDMAGTPGALLDLGSFVTAHALLILLESRWNECEFAAEKKARRLFGLEDRRY